MSEVFPEKYFKKIKDSTFVEEMESKSQEEIKKEIVNCEERMYALDKEMEADANLQKAKEDVKKYASAYREVMAIEKAKIKYCLHVMSDRGYELQGSPREE